MQKEHFVMPEVYWVGYTEINAGEMYRYLRDTDQLEFEAEIKQALTEGLSAGEILCSFYAKTCYASLTTKKNDNITMTRSIYNNILSTIESGHGSVFEHCNLNFQITNCSRVFTHEMVRHRVGTAFSQTSGRYVRSDTLNVVVDPILEPVAEDCEWLRQVIENWYNARVAQLKLNEMKNFNQKKKITSALRRFMPNGQSNEIGVTLNLRALRHTLEMRTAGHAEWEIRIIFNRIADLIAKKYPAMFADASFNMVDDIREITFKNKKI